MLALPFAVECDGLLERHALELDILPQPDETTCGPTCLHAVYRFFGDAVSLDTIIQQTSVLSEGGTLAVMLGCHALRRGYRATIVTMNLHVFDPTWFIHAPHVPIPGERVEEGDDLDWLTGEPATSHSQIGRLALTRAGLINKLTTQSAVKGSEKLSLATRHYIDFLELGGNLRMRDFDSHLIRAFLRRELPILTGLSSTYLYRGSREMPDTTPNDTAGFPAGHFVVLSGYDQATRQVSVADPYLPNPLGVKHHYQVAANRLIAAILLGVLTYDANLLVIEPADSHPHSS